jgi:hypothetical protein
MSDDAVAFVCQVALYYRYLLAQAGKGPEERESFEAWRERVGQ